MPETAPARPGAAAFFALAGLDAAAKSLLITVVPLDAYALLGTPRLVTIAYAAVSVLGLIGVLTVPLLLHRIGRRRMFVLAGGLYMAAGLLFALRSPNSLLAAMALHMLGAVSFEVVFNLYLLDHIPRRELSTFEPRRVLFSGTTFAIGPAVGVILDQRIAANLTFFVVAAIPLALFAVYWGSGMQHGGGKTEARQPPPNPLNYVGRYFSQPRLVLAWFLAFGRSGWWSMFFVYAPIYTTLAGYEPEIGGLVTSIGLAPMLLMQVWGRLAQRFGIRRLLIACFAGVGALTLAAGASYGMPVLSISMLCLAAWCATIIDAAGNVPFLRAVHPFERTQMTAVFLTFRHATSLSSLGIYAVVLSVLPLAFVFVTSGLFTLSMAMVSRALPRRM